jgi:hypothetical protein
MWPRWYVPPHMRRIPASDMITFVCRSFKVTPEMMRSDSRVRHVVNARAVFCEMMRRQGLSSPATGRLLSRDHSSVLHLLHTWRDRLHHSPEMVEIMIQAEEFRLGLRRLAEPRPVAVQAQPVAVRIVGPKSIPKVQAPKPRRQKPKNDFGPGTDDVDEAHRFQASIAIGSASLLAAIQEARAA